MGIVYEGYTGIRNGNYFILGYILGFYKKCKECVSFHEWGHLLENRCNKGNGFWGYTRVTTDQSVRRSFRRDTGLCGSCHFLLHLPYIQFQYIPQYKIITVISTFPLSLYKPNRQPMVLGMLGRHGLRVEPWRPPLGCTLRQVSGKVNCGLPITEAGFFAMVHLCESASTSTSADVWCLLSRPHPSSPLRSGALGVLGPQLTSNSIVF